MKSPSTSRATSSMRGWHMGVHLEGGTAPAREALAWTASEGTVVETGTSFFGVKMVSVGGVSISVIAGAIMMEWIQR